MRAPRVAVVTNVIPHYNGAFYQRLVERQDIDVHVFCQVSLPGLNLELVHDRFSDHVTLVRAASFEREQLAWQWLPWPELLRYDVLVVMGNPRVVSSVVLAVMAGVIRKPVVIWGQAHSVFSSNLGEGLRLWWWKRFDHLLVYTEQEAQWLRDRGFRGNIVGMNNGLDQRAIDTAASEWDAERLTAWREAKGLEGRAQVLSCARLEPKNRYDLWLRAMPAVLANYPDLVWCVIGDGRERHALEALAQELGVAERIRWLGVILEERELSPWFLSSQLLVHPAGIGLTLLHAFGYGLPAVTHDDASGHSPEFHAFVPGETGLLYSRDDAGGLTRAVCDCLSDESRLSRMGEHARRIAREKYNVDVMAERFADVAKQAVARSGSRTP